MDEETGRMQADADAAERERIEEEAEARGAKAERERLQALIDGLRQSRHGLPVPRTDARVRGYDAAIDELARRQRRRRRPPPGAPNGPRSRDTIGSTAAAGLPAR